tara:strand:+ start:1048 stop:1179 length:132 start_codon:yes stop_codon:yes gene_type:complete
MNTENQSRETVDEEYEKHYPAEPIRERVAIWFFNGARDGVNVD